MVSGLGVEKVMHKIYVKFSKRWKVWAAFRLESEQESYWWDMRKKHPTWTIRMDTPPELRRSRYVSPEFYYYKSD